MGSRLTDGRERLPQNHGDFPMKKMGGVPAVPVPVEFSLQSNPLKLLKLTELGVLG